MWLVGQARGAVSTDGALHFPDRERDPRQPALRAERKGSTVPDIRVCKGSTTSARLMPALAFSAAILAIAPATASGQAPLPAVTVGGGLQTSYVHTSPDGEGATDTDEFQLNSLRLYLNGSVTPTTKFMFTAQFDSGTNRVVVVDAAARFEFRPQFNIWAGRFLPPSDRANLYGPYYSNHWAVYTDGVQDGYPFIFQGRDNGVAYWGDFGPVKLSGGVFDGPTATGRNEVITAGRAQVDFWDRESGYYLNGTYYGDKNLLAVGVAGQVQKGEDSADSSRTAASADFLLERKVAGGGVVSVEAEWARYHRLGGYNGRYGLNDGGYGLAGFMFPQQVGAGKIQVLGKYAKARFKEGLTTLDPNYDQKTSELDINYIIKQHNARVMFFVLDTRFNAVQTNFWKVGVGIQLQM
jgi:hypothetical protein